MRKRARGSFGVRRDAIPLALTRRSGPSEADVRVLLIVLTAVMTATAAAMMTAVASAVVLS